MSEIIETRPMINVTPLIDILLVLLIIFMAISPLKPARFEAKVPSESKDLKGQPNIHTLIVTINPDSSLALNGEKDLGTIDEPQKLVDYSSITNAISTEFDQPVGRRLRASGFNVDDNEVEILE